MVLRRGGPRTGADRHPRGEPGPPRARMPAMNVTVTGASGLIGAKLVERLRARGDAVTTLSRRPAWRDAMAWAPEQEPAPPAALSVRDAVVHLAGENVAQRWSD